LQREKLKLGGGRGAGFPFTPISDFDCMGNGVGNPTSSSKFKLQVEVPRSTLCFFFAPALKGNRAFAALVCIVHSGTTMQRRSAFAIAPSYFFRPRVGAPSRV
jgi:hypothetical protein